MRKEQRLLAFFCMLWAGGAALAAPRESGNMLVNAHWEHGTGGWRMDYDPGVLECVRPGHDSRACMKITPAAGAKKIYVRQMLPRLDFWGAQCRFSVWARGEGTLALTLHVIYESPRGVEAFRMLKSPAWPLQDRWQKCEHTFRITTPAIRQVLAAFWPTGSSCLVDDACLTLTKDAESITPTIPHLVLPEDEKATVVFRRKSGSGPLTAFDGREMRTIMPERSGEYVLSCVPRARSAAVYDVGTPAGAHVYIDYLPRTEWQRMDQLSRKVRLQRPISLLFIGDSLSDFERGRNYADKFVFWLARHNPGKVRFRNAGVAGDWVIRVLERLKDPVHTPDGFRYENLFGSPYDCIFVFLGHNDTRITWSEKTRSYRQLVSPERQRSDYAELLAYLHARMPAARVIPMTPMCMNHEISLGLCAEKIKNHRSHTLFGDPSRLKEYGETIRKIAKDRHLPVVDLLSLSSSVPGNEVFFTDYDGVHLKTPGSSFAAEQMLKCWLEIFPSK